MEIHQAAGMVSIQADCETRRGLRSDEERAAVAHRSLDDIAAAVIDRSIRFDD